MSIHFPLDYLVRTSYQPYERSLPMTVTQLRSIGKAVDCFDGFPGIHSFGDYIIYNGLPDRYFSYDTMNPEAEPGDVG